MTLKEHCKAGLQSCWEVSSQRGRQWKTHAARQKQLQPICGGGGCGYFDTFGTLTGTFLLWQVLFYFDGYFFTFMGTIQKIWENENPTWGRSLGQWTPWWACPGKTSRFQSSWWSRSRKEFLDSKFIQRRYSAYSFNKAQKINKENEIGCIP